MTDSTPEQHKCQVFHISKEINICHGTIWHND